MFDSILAMSPLLLVVVIAIMYKVGESEYKKRFEDMEVEEAEKLLKMGSYKK